MNVSIVIVAHQSRPLLTACLESVRLQGDAGDPPETWLIDNASSDETTEWLAHAFPWVRTVRNPTNSGFARAANQGLQLATQPFVLFLNPDARLPEGGLAAMRLALQLELGALLVGPRLVGGGPPGWGELPSLALLLRNHLPGSRREAKREPPAGPVGWLLGACLLGRTRPLLELGGFDEDYFLYGEDLDLCDRAAAAGFLVVYHPDVEVAHIGNDRWDAARLSRVHGALAMFFRKRRSFGAYLAVRCGLMVLDGYRALTGSAQS